ncbi:phage portal protein [Aeromonas salmonicida]|uniref:phage portal protein n=2 Tax=Aeromonas salmonicida TaxID=645 RepID=UPI0029B6C857|nr:phage portal protein [Aeromonas salmonicida]HEH9424197.1 phage portal protein [Aeromonas salmonicida]HEH9437443.1 phage portal protein [Aeromonas salmonicida]
MFNRKKSISTNGYYPPSAGTPFQIGQWNPTNEILNEPTVLSCLRLISGSITSMPLTVKSYDNQYYDRYSKDLNQELKVILVKPNHNETILQFISKVVGHLVLHNEAFIKVSRGGIGTSGKVSQIECIEYGRVQRVNNNGRWQYVGNDNSNKPIQQDEIHYLTTTRVGFDTLSNLEKVRAVIEVGNNSINHSKEFYNTSPRNSGWFTSTDQLSDEEYSRLKEQITVQAQQTGYGLIEGVAFTPNTYSFKDAMSIETRKQTTSDICNVMGVHPSLLGLEWASGIALSDIRSIFLSTTINPLVLCIEEFYNNVFLERGYEIDMQEQGLLAASYEDRAKLAMEQFKIGLISKNEARVDMAELENGGDDFVVDSNNLTMGNLNNNNENK